MTIILRAAVQRWECDHCSLRDVTTGQPNRFHHCPGMAGMLTPMVLEGSRVKITANEREDYIGTEDVQLDENGRPVMNITTERPDGSTDVVAFAPCATVRMVN